MSRRGNLRCAWECECARATLGCAANKAASVAEAPRGMDSHASFSEIPSGTGPLHGANTGSPEPPTPPAGPVVTGSEPPPPYPGRGSGTALVLFSFSISIVAGIGFLFVYWTGGGNMLLGSTLALCFLGFGCALVFWSHRLMRQEEVSAPREPMPSSLEEYEALFEDFYPGEPNIQRRKLITWMSVTVVLTLAAAWISVLRSFFGVSPYAAPLKSTIWKRGQRLMTDTGDIASIHTLQAGGSVIVFPENQRGFVNAQTVLLRVPEEFISLPKDRAGWAPKGYLAYSRICTHAGCPVGLFESENDLLLCPCHQSTFNVLDGAQPTGGPAARPLPQLPLYVDEEGNLRAGGGFSAPPGPGFWSMTS